MNSELLARLTQAEPEERPWLLTEAVLDSLSVELGQAVWAAAVPHWFDAKIVAALCPSVAESAATVYEALQKLSFVERFGERGHNIHEATRQLLLDRLYRTRLEEFRAVSARAAAYFADEKTYPAEWLYHQAVTVQIADDLSYIMTPLDHNYRRSESEAILQALSEQIVANRVDASVAAETEYWSGKVHQRFYEPNAALARYETAIAIYREVGDRLGEANTMAGLAHLNFEEGDYTKALQLYQQRVEINHQIGNVYGEGWTYLYIGRTLTRLAQKPEARKAYELAIELFGQIGMTDLCDEVQEELNSIN